MRIIRIYYNIHAYIVQHFSDFLINNSELILIKDIVFCIGKNK